MRAWLRFLLPVQRMAANMVDQIIYRAVCCREWPVLGLGERMGKCGYCKEVPQIVGLWNEKEN